MVQHLRSVRNHWFYPLLSLVLVPVLFFECWANDFWKHLYAGRYLIQRWGFPIHSEFTFSPITQPYSQYLKTWLGDGLIYLGYEAVGLPGLQLLRFGMVLGLLILVHSLVRFRSNPLIWLALVFMVMGSHQALRLRNNMILVPMIPALIWCWYQIRYQDRWWWLAGPVVLLGIWANIHGSYLAGIGIFGLMVIGAIMEDVLQSEVDWKWFGASVATVIVAVMVVTYVGPAPKYRLLGVVGRIPQLGQTGILSEPPAERPEPVRTRSWYGTVRNFLQNTVQSTSSDRLPASEYKFPLEAHPYLYVVVSLGLVPIGLLVFLLSWRNIRLDLLLPFLAVCLVGLGYLRTLALIPLATVPFVLIKYREGDLPSPDRLTVTNGIGWLGIVVLTVNLFLLTFTGNMSAFAGTNFYQVGLGVHPIRSRPVSRYVLNHYPDRRVLNTVNNGAYLIWRWWPRKKVFIDSKTSAYDREFYWTMRRLDFRKRAERYDLSVALVNTYDSAYMLSLLSADNWELVVFDQGMMVFERVDEAEYVSPEQASLVEPGNVDEFSSSVRQHWNDTTQTIRSVRP